MIQLLRIACLLVLASSSTVPTRQHRDHIATLEYFNKQATVMYTSQHDIVKIYVPFNEYNVEGNISRRIAQIHKIFFVEADVEDGQVKEKGLYVFEDGKATKLLDNGRDAAATNENVVYFGASDGIYKYNEADKRAEKYGTVTDNIIQLAHSNKTNFIYYLTDRHELYKLSEDAKTSVKVPLEDVQSVVFDFFDNLYYYDSNKNVYVVTSGAGTVPEKIEGLPSEMHDISLISSMYAGSVSLCTGNNIYRLKPNTPAFRNPVIIDVKITASAPQASVIQFYGIDKKIYKLDFTTKHERTIANS